MKQDLISVIIPMYKMEKFIGKCLDSVCASSYKNLEILCVDDGSPDTSAQIALTYAEKDPRVRVVKNPQNLGLFRARVEGMKVAKGDYIAFVDADDFVSVDWFRLLHKKITEEKTDMVIGNTVNVDENLNYTYYNNYRSLTTSHKTLRGEEVLKTFLNQEGACFMWHTVWNKLYSRKLVEECMPYFKKVNFHLIMGEDIAYSSVFYSHAKSLSFANADAYFYYRHSEASTSITLPLEKVLKNIADLKSVFDYFENCMKEYDLKLYKNNKKSIEKFKARYHRIWSGNIWNKNAQNNPHALEVLKNTFGTDKIILPKSHDFYFYELITIWSQRFENIKKQITSNNIKVVSFDIFDTLIVRPFYIPDDIFYFVGKFASKLLPEINEKAFVEFRRIAEEEARKHAKINKPMFEDVTLTEIYELLEKLMKIDSQISNKIMAEEKRLEIKFCQARKTGKELFELALETGKTVVLTSDMYLEKETIEQILTKNGLTGYSKLFLSSDKRVLKSSGKLFETMIKNVGVNANQIIHIGDNWNVDIVAAGNKGLNTIFLPKTLETFENGISDIYVGNDLSFYKKRRQELIEQPQLQNDLAIRCMLSVSANKMFDNPYNTFQWESNYNADTYLTGYHTLGMHLTRLAIWILEKARENNYKKIVFFARDGYVVKQIFEELIKTTGDKIETDYFYATRKALLPFSIKSEKDLYKTYEFIDIKAHTPRSVLKLFSAITNKLDEATEKEYKKQYILLDNNFENKNEFIKFIDVMIKLSFNKELCKSNNKALKNYFLNKFSDGTVTFDIGYSGRLQNIICDIAGKPIDTMFIHSNGYSSEIICKNKFKTHCFYDFTPTMSGITREFFISESSPSCVGYNITKGNLEFIFEDKDFAYETTYAINEMQKGAVDFAKDYITTFGEFIDNLPCRNIDASLPFEHYLLHASQFDRYAFSSALVEDNVYGGYEAKSIFDIWSWHLNNMEANVKYITDQKVIERHDTMFDYISKLPRFKRALFYFLFDKKMFKQKMKNRRKNKKNKKQ